jgi:hypothetical protein
LKRVWWWSGTGSRVAVVSMKKCVVEKLFDEGKGERMVGDFWRAVGIVGRGLVWFKPGLVWYFWKSILPRSIRGRDI